MQKSTGFILIAVLFSFQTLCAQSSYVSNLIDSTIDVMKKYAVNKKTVDWKGIADSAKLLAKDAEKPYQMGNSVRYIFKSINDFHGAFFYMDSTFQWQPNQVNVSDSFRNEWKKGVRSITMMLDKNIGYIRVPSMPIANKEEFNIKAQSLNDSLCSLLSKNNVKGLVVDLRLNGGGAMHPMILGLKQLLTDGKLGEFHTDITESWILKGNQFLIDTVAISTIKPFCNIDASKIPVVIITSPITGSSAENLIMAFKGRKNTILLGSRTAGYITINNGFAINDTAFINLAVGYSSDRSGKLYTEAIDPEIPMTAVDKFNDIPNDEKVKAAAAWIRRKF
ncbi:S41 family peptidase [Pollutibacter soli]|uniref:S41 family peptidase n=1 Tax=Pollutibacter soli TaxID=3034157 RepID=UPI003013BBED